MSAQMTGEGGIVTVSPLAGMKHLMPNSCITFCFRNSILAASPCTSITLLGAAWTAGQRGLGVNLLLFFFGHCLFSAIFVIRFVDLTCLSSCIIPLASA